MDKITYKGVKLIVKGDYTPICGADGAEYDVYGVYTHDSKVDISQFVDCKEFQDALIRQIEEEAEEWNSQLGTE